MKNTIVLDNSHILSAVYPKNGTYSRGISFSNMNGSSIEMKNNSTIKGFYYAINVTALNDNLSISIVDSKIDSWAALNIWSSNNKFKIANSTLESHNYQLKGSNDFATIVLNKDEEDNAINNSFDIKILICLLLWKVQLCNILFLFVVRVIHLILVRALY